MCPQIGPRPAASLYFVYTFGANRRIAMRICKRILAGLILLLSVAGLLISLAAGVGVWVVKAPVTARVNRIFDRVDSGLDLADESLDQVKASLDRAAQRLESVKEEQRKLAQNPPRGSATRRFMARTVQQQIAPDLGNAHEKFHTIAAAAVVVNSVLEDVESVPSLETSGLDVDRLAEINRRLSQVESSAWELTRLLGDPEADADAEAALSRIEQVLQTLQGLIADYALRVKEFRHRTEELKARTFAWITYATIAISLVSFWIALSQVSLLCHAWSWLWRSTKQRIDYR
jgi:hypothetical protein